MLISELPLLPGEWIHWDWSKSNWDAMPDQTKQAYEVLTNQGLCSGFSREVWNDLISLLSFTLASADLEWDSTYGTDEECKITEALGVFTANAFNAVVLNLNQLGIFRWTWEGTNNLPGYLGTKYVRGYAEYGNDSDFVYGWYITELTDKFNKLVSVLENTADFSELDGPIKAELFNALEIFSGVSVHLLYETGSSSYLKTDFESAYVIAISKIEKAYSYHTGEIINRLPKRMNADAFGISDTASKIALAKRQDILSGESANTYSGSELTRLLYGQRLFYLKPIVVNYTPGFAVPYAPKFEHIKRAKTYDDVSLTSIRQAFWIDVAVKGVSHGVSELINGISHPITGTSKENSYIQNEMVLRDRTVIDGGVESSKSMQDSTLHCRCTWYLRRLIKASSYHENDISTRISTPIEKSDSSTSYQESEVASCGLSTYAKLLESFSENETEVFAAYGDPLNILDSLTRAYADGDIKSLSGKFLDSALDAKSYSAGEITDGIPEVFEYIENEQSCEDSDIVSGSSEAFLAYKLIEEKIYTELQGDQSAAFGGNYKSFTSIVCELEFESTKETWYDPVQNGNRLYIRSAYPQWQEGTNVHLDSGGVFYEPEQTGANVYIRSADSLG